MPVPILDLCAEYRSIKGEIDAAVGSVLESGHFVLGPNVSGLEKEVASYVGTKFAVAVASGTDALFLSLKAAGIKEGDEVITTPLTFFATAEAISYCGARPVFVDVYPDTHNIDVSKIEEKITKKTKAILPVHLWGQPAEIEQIAAIAKKHGLKVIEDCAQAFGSALNGRKVGSFGTTGCFSFFPTKNLGAYGDGGMITTNDEDMYEKLKLLHLHGSKKRGIHEIIGYNSRLDEIQAAILRVKLKYIDGWNDARRKNAAHYSTVFSKKKVKCPVEKPGYRHIYHQYTIEIDNREKVIFDLAQKGITAFVYYPNPLHIQEAYKDLGYKPGSMPVSEEIGGRMLSIPVHAMLSDDDVESVAQEVLGAL